MHLTWHPSKGQSACQSLDQHHTITPLSFFGRCPTIALVENRALCYSLAVMTILPLPLRYALIAGLVILYALAWTSTQKHLTDFPAFYSSARLWTAGENPYDKDAECRIQAQIRPDLCLANTHSPVLLPLFVLVSSENYTASYNRWSAVLLVVLAVCIWVNYRLFANLETSVHGVLFYPVFISITQGNVSPFILLSVSLWVLLLKERKDLAAGIALSLSVVKPQLALLLAIPLCLARPKAFLGFCIGASALVIFSFILVGPEGFHSLVATITSMMRAQEAGTDPPEMYSVTGLLTRAGLNRLWAWPIFLSAIIGIGFLWRRTDTSLPSLMLGIVVAVFASPHLFLHDASLLVLPLLMIHPLAPVFASLGLLLFFAGGFPYAGGYLLMFGLAAWLLRSIRLGKPKHIATSSHPCRRHG